jgi:hypothetical protein
LRRKAGWRDIFSRVVNQSRSQRETIKPFPHIRQPAFHPQGRSKREGVLLMAKGRKVYPILTSDSRHSTHRGGVTEREGSLDGKGAKSVSYPHIRLPAFHPSGCSLRERVLLMAKGRKVHHFLIFRLPAFRPQGRSLREREDSFDGKGAKSVSCPHIRQPAFPPQGCLLREGVILAVMGPKVDHFLTSVR